MEDFELQATKQAVHGPKPLVCGLAAAATSTHIYFIGGRGPVVQDSTLSSLYSLDIGSILFFRVVCLFVDALLCVHMHQHCSE
jgi:hypothetical protein